MATVRPVAREALEALAERWGQSARSVRAAVDDGFIHKARPYGGGRGRAPTWLYPPGTDRTLRALYRLQYVGYRGDALRFAFWWLGLAAWSPAVRDYVLANLHAMRSGPLMRWRTALADANQGTAVGVDVTADEESDISLADVIRTELDGPAAARALAVVEQFHRDVDPRSDLTLEDVAQVQRVWIAALSGLYPEDLGGRAFFVEQYVLSDVAMAPEQARTAHPALSAIVREMHTPEWFTMIAEILRTASEQEYDAARALLIPICGRFTVPVNRALADVVPKLSARTIKRLGPARYRAVAIRAMLVGWLVVIPRLLTAEPTDAPAKGGRQA